MSELTLDRLSMPTAPLGTVNPLPPLFPARNSPSPIDVSQVDAELQANSAYGRVKTIAPHLLQDQYGRKQTMLDHRVAVLENETLRATFLLDSGGRLWSLIHKPTNRELLFRNDTFQPANLALRNAWFAGGIEWNIGTIGHTPGTCDPIHAARAERPDGTPVLRMYEFDRVRQVVYQLDAYLPDESEVLFVHVRIVNPNDHEVPMYWWSNIAVEQTEHTRVIAPAESAWNYSYDSTLKHISVVPTEKNDISYPARGTAAADYFFDLKKQSRPWIAAVDGTGSGLIQCSTRQLQGRKLFLWGNSAGGRHWQEWLVGADRSYLEIQAGLARTQLEHLPLPAHEQISWVETYGLITVDAAVAHGELTGARTAIERQLPASAVLDRECQDADLWSQGAPLEILHTASGWGALEQKLRRSRNDDSLDLDATPFPPESLAREQSDWVQLIDTGEFSDLPPETFPPSLQVSADWDALLENASGWLAAAQLGNSLAYRDDHAGARAAWTRSIGECPNVLAHRNLAALDAFLSNWDAAVAGYASARALAPDSLPLAIESIDTLIAAGLPHRALEIIDSLGTKLRSVGRVGLFEARAALDAGELERCGRVLSSGLEIADIREGEVSLDDLWWRYQRALRVAGGEVDDEQLDALVRRESPLPEALDFRMH